MPTLSELDRDLLHGGAAVGGCRIVEPIAQDDGGILYVVDDPMLQRHVLIREHFPLGLAARGDQGEVVLVAGSDAGARAAALAAFLRGARWLTRFDHPAIGRVLRVWEERGTAYQMMPLYDGETLAAWLQHSGAVDENALRRLLAGLCDALSVLHAAGVYHLGLSPDTIWVLPDGRPMLLDLSAAAPAAQRVVSDSVVRQYAPIELFAHGSALPVGAWTDIYSLGAVAHQVLLGRPPVSAAVLGPNDLHAPIAEGFSRRAPGRRHLAAPSAAFLAAIDRALAVRPENRPQNLAALRALLDLTGSTPVPQTAPIERPQPPRPPLGTGAEAVAASASAAVPPSVPTGTAPVGMAVPGEPPTLSERVDAPLPPDGASARTPSGGAPARPASDGLPGGAPFGATARSEPGFAGAEPGARFPEAAAARAPMAPNDDPAPRPGPGASGPGSPRAEPSLFGAATATGAPASAGGATAAPRPAPSPAFAAGPAPAGRPAARAPAPAAAMAGADSRQEPVFGPAPAPVHAGAHEEAVDPAAAAAIAMAVSSLPWAKEDPAARDDRPPEFGRPGPSAYPPRAAAAREPGVGTPAWTMPGPARRRPSKAARQAPTRAVAALFGLIACVGMVGWYVADNPQLVAGWVDGPAQTAPQQPEAPAPVAQAAAPAPVAPPARGADAMSTSPDVERALTEAPPAAGPATVPDAATLPPDGIDAGESVVPTPARPAAVPPVTTGATPAVPPAEAARTAPVPGPDPAAPAPRERRTAPAGGATATATAEADAGAEGPARGTGRHRPVRPAEPVAAVEPAAPTSPRAICGTRANFALYRCMETQCGTGRWSRHPQCVLWRIENQ